MHKYKQVNVPLQENSDWVKGGKSNNVLYEKQYIKSNSERYKVKRIKRTGEDLPEKCKQY